MFRTIPKILTTRARAMRNIPSPIEQLLWKRISRRQIDGHKFRRQFVIGPYIADFACIEKKLVIELDGDTHAGREDYDAKRTAYIESQGYKVIRFSNSEVFSELEGVVNTIYAILTGQIATNR